MSLNFKMVTVATKLCGSSHSFRNFTLQYLYVHSNSSLPTLVESIRAAVEEKTYHRIPDLLIDSKESIRNPNPFSFLSSFSQNQRTQIIDEVLQSFIPLRPRSRPQAAYSCLLSYTLQSPDPLPLSLAILQRTLRSGFTPIPQTRLLLSTAWVNRRDQSQSVPNILSEMKSIRYRPDSGTCNYLISSLCAVDHLTEAVSVLKGMGGAGCVPDADSYGLVIGAMCGVRRSADVADKMREMVAKMGLMPRHETVAKVIVAMRAKKEIRRSVEMIEFLEEKGIDVRFESYEMVVQGCLERGEFVLAGKVVMGMTGKGFIPYIKVRQKVVEGLASVGEWGFACVLRQRFAELKS